MHISVLLVPRIRRLNTEIWNFAYSSPFLAIFLYNIHLSFWIGLFLVDRRRFHTKTISDWGNSLVQHPFVVVVIIDYSYISLITFSFWLCLCNVTKRNQFENNNVFLKKNDLNINCWIRKSDFLSRNIGR